MITLLEMKVASVAYGSDGAIAHLLKSLDAPPVVYDYVFFNTDDGYFTKASMPGAGVINDPLKNTHRVPEPDPLQSGPPNPNSVLPAGASGDPNAWQPKPAGAIDSSTAAWYANPGVAPPPPSGSRGSISDARRYAGAFGAKTSTGDGAHEFEYQMDEKDPRYPGQTIQPGFSQRAASVVGSAAGKVAGAPRAVQEWGKDKWADIQNQRDLNQKRKDIEDYTSKLSEDQIRGIHAWQFPDPAEMAAGRKRKHTMRGESTTPTDKHGNRIQGPLDDLARHFGSGEQSAERESQAATYREGIDNLSDDDREIFNEIYEKFIATGDPELQREALSMISGTPQYAEVDPNFKQRDDGDDNNGTPSEVLKPSETLETQVAAAVQNESKLSNDAKGDAGKNDDGLGDVTNVPDKVTNYKDPEVETTSSTEVGVKNPLPFNEAVGTDAEPIDWQHGFGGGGPWDIAGTDKDHWDTSMYDDITTRANKISQAKRNDDGSIMVDENNEPIMEEVPNPNRNTKARHHGGGIVGAHRSFRDKRDDGRPRGTHMDKVRAIAQHGLGDKSMWVDPKTGQIDIPRTQKIWADAEKQYKGARKQQALDWRESLPEDDERRAGHRKGDDSGWKNVVTKRTSWDDYLDAMQMDDPLAWRSWRDEEDGMGEHGGLDPEVFESMSPRRQKAWMDAVEAEHADVDGVRGGASFLQQMYPELHKLGPSAIKDALEAHQKFLQEEAKKENAIKVQREKKIGTGAKAGGEVKEGGDVAGMDELAARFKASKEKPSESKSRFAEYNFTPDAHDAFDSVYDGTLMDEIFDNTELRSMLKDIDFSVDENHEEQREMKAAMQKVLQNTPAYKEAMEHILPAMNKLPAEERKNFTLAWQQAIEDHQDKLFKKSLSPLDRAFGTFHGGVW